ncbi:MAG: hypothetical protein KKF12_06795 [Proteobacteria bacterium]|nr:hypothetical protein [Desulfobacula sp.]MBU3952678.1 hypothetical protein [Pseudomonadota bacterium]MBU4130509.1 hypothetical protein [Pseudomonadota bacterium]
MIKDDLQKIVDYKQIYLRFEEIVNHNFEHVKKNNGILFCDFVRESFIVNAAVCIRRHRKIDNSISLMKLLNQIEKCSNQFTYDFYLQIYPKENNEYGWQEITFNNFSDDNHIISEKKIHHDMLELDQISKTVSDFVDIRIAHLDRKNQINKPTYGDVYDALDLLNEIACKYFTLITSNGYSTLAPSILYDWEKVFREPFNISNE